MRDQLNNLSVKQNNMKTSTIETRLEKKGYSISYCPRQTGKCGFVVKRNGNIYKIFDSANQAAKHFGFIK